MSCATAKCAADQCAGLTTYCSDSETCVLKLDDEGTSSTQAATTQAPGGDNSAAMNPANQQKFADDLTKILYTKPNECTSSLGVSMAFSLVYPGATNDGITEIKNTFGYPDGSNLQLVWQGTTERMLKSASGECVGGTSSFDGSCWAEAPLLKIANSVWLDNRDTLNEDYATVVGDYAMQTDFQSPDSPIIVNEWVNDQTNGLIDSIVDPTKPLSDYVLLAINSIYLKAQWAEQFEERHTNLDTFYASPSRSTKVSDAHFMHLVEYQEYSHDALMGYQILKLRLKQSSMSMIFLLPLTDGVGAVSSADVISAMDKLESRKIALALPKFKFESQYEDSLKSALMTLGVESPFTENTNSLCGLLQDYDCAKLIITKVIQKTVIDVNEKGVEAAAVTAVGVSVTSMPEPEDPTLMVLDHPFQFFIYDGEEGLMLFEGRLGEPEVPEKEPSIPLLSAKHLDGDFWSSNFFVNPIEAHLPVTMTSSTAAFVDCSALTTCSECLENEGCAHWTAGECMPDCLVADAACYTNTGGFTGMTVDEICTKADDDSKDSALCGSMTDCTLCVEAVKSDGKSTCMWFEDGYCDTGCNMIGCGSTDVSTCSGAASTQATSAAGGIVSDAETTQAPGNDATTTQAPGNDATTTQAPGDDVTTTQAPGEDATTSTTSTVPAFKLDESNDPDSSGNSLFVCIWTTISMASLLCYVW